MKYLHRVRFCTRKTFDRLPLLCYVIQHYDTAVTSEKPVICKIHIIKKADKGDGYKRKSTWELSDLKSVDGKVQAGQGEE